MPDAPRPAMPIDEIRTILRSESKLSEAEITQLSDKQARQALELIVIEKRQRARLRPLLPAWVERGLITREQAENPDWEYLASVYRDEGAIEEYHDALARVGEPKPAALPPPRVVSAPPTAARVSGSHPYRTLADNLASIEKQTLLLPTLQSTEIAVLQREIRDLRHAFECGKFADLLLEEHAEIIRHLAAVRDGLTLRLETARGRWRPAIGVIAAAFVALAVKTGFQLWLAIALLPIMVGGWVLLTRAELSASVRDELEDFIKQLRDNSPLPIRKVPALDFNIKAEQSGPAGVTAQMRIDTRDSRETPPRIRVASGSDVTEPAEELRADRSGRTMDSPKESR